MNNSHLIAIDEWLECKRECIFKDYSSTVAVCKPEYKVVSALCTHAGKFLQSIHCLSVSWNRFTGRCLQLLIKPQDCVTFTPQHFALYDHYTI